MRIKYPLLVAIVMSCAISALAIPARRNSYVITQPDGTTLTVHKVGDESRHFTLTDDDKLLVRDANGQYSYASISTTGALTSTGVKAVDSAVRPASHLSYTKALSDIDTSVMPQSRARQARRAIAQDGMGKFTSNFPTKGEIHGLVLLVQFADTKFGTSYYSTSAKQYFTDLISKKGFSENGATGSATDYFEDASMGQFQPKFTVVGPLTLSKKAAYYGGNGNSGDGGDENLGEILTEALNLADPDVNFADYDNDGDGVCDYVYIFYAGEGEASSSDEDTIWPHSWTISEATDSKIYLDGVQIETYACSNEIVDDTPEGIGTFVHEFSHVMGLPDLYHTSNNSAYYTPCDYDVMDYGPYNNDGRTPPTYSAYERNAMGWIELDVISGAEVVSLEHIATSNKACIVQTSKDTEFFLFENRQQSGWDKYIPNHGMLIWHIDFNQSVFDQNVVNNTKSHQYVDIVEANNNASGGESKSVRQGWIWPGTSGKTSFTSSTTPAFKTWSGTAIDLPITDIAESNGIITFNVSGGIKIDTPIPHETARIETGADYFVAAWDPVATATDYKVWVYAVADTDAAAVKAAASTDSDATETADMGSSASTISLPTGWSSSSLGTYSTSGNYGQSAPSAKMSSGSAYIQTRKYDGDVVGISFWCKGMSTDNSSSALIITGLVDNSWVDIATITPTSNKSATKTITDIPTGVSQVKFTYNKDKGNFAIDDIVITIDDGRARDEVLPDYNGVLTGGATTLRIDKLKEGCSKYKFAVAATPNGTAFSKTSEYVYVDLVDPSGIADIADNAARLSVSAIGRTINVSTAATDIEVFNAMGALVASQSTSDGNATITLPAAGLYIVRAGGNTAKVVVR